MATSPNYGWLEPDNTDLLKNGALAIRTLGNAIDSTMATMTPKSIVDAKGDLIAATANDTPARLAAGANNLVLTTDSAEATGLKYAGAWATWTPTYNGITVGNGTVVARFARTGRTVTANWRLTFGSTTSLTGNLLLIKLPTDTGGQYATYTSIMGLVKYSGVSGEFTGYLDWYNDTFGVRLMTSNASGTYVSSSSTSAAIPFTFATADVISFTLTYEAAA